MALSDYQVFVDVPGSFREFQNGHDYSGDLGGY